MFLVALFPYTRVAKCLVLLCLKAKAGGMIMEEGAPVNLVVENGHLPLVTIFSTYLKAYHFNINYSIFYYSMWSNARELAFFVNWFSIQLV